MRVAFVSSEVTPYASTGGLADVCGSLPQALVALGVETVSFMPMYRKIIEGSFPVENTGIQLSIPVGFHHYRADIWKTKGKTPDVYFIRRDEFFDRSYFYNLPDRDYDDNFERFIFFQKAVTALIDHLGKPFDIVHAHDWQTGLLPLYLRHGLSGEGRLCREKIVMTVHNLSFQGVFNGDEYSYTNLPFSCFSVDTLEFYGNVNCLKGGIIASDLVTTVSQTYAKEVQTSDWGCGLQGVFASINAKFRGILNGIDTDSWNPATDKHIAEHYSASDISGKAACKADLIRRMKLTIKAADPLFGMVTRLTPQKGIELLDEVLPFLMSETSAGFVLLGSGSAEQESLVSGWAKRWPGRVVVKMGFDVKLSRRIEAGCDMYLMPSKFEPCGLNQLYSLRYGTIPIVHGVGGLEDTIVDASSDPSHGYGFKFADYRVEAFEKSISHALAAYAKKDVWKSIQQRAMATDFSWTRSAREYSSAYRQLTGR